MTHTIIRIKLHRKGGSEIDLYGKIYHFRPEDPAADDNDKKIPHVCAIPNEDAKAIHRLLSIKDAYELADPDAELPAKPKAEPGQTVALDKAEAKPDVIITNGDGEQINLSQMEPDKLRELARDDFGIRVHHKWKDADVIAKIIEAMRAASAEE